MLVLESTEWVEMSDTIFNTILLTMKISKNVLSHAHTRMQHFEKMIEIVKIPIKSPLLSLTPKPGYVKIM